MKVFDDIFGQAEAVAYLTSSVENRSINHAYLFSGPPSVGKLTTAKMFSAAINCLDSGCGACAACTAVLEAQTDDIMIIEPEGSHITIGQVRKIIEDVSKKPTLLRYKVVIIDEAHLITVQAANALLKSLEEPPSFRVVFILITQNAGNILETVRSRCILVNFHPLSDESIARYLISKFSMEPEEAEYKARLYDGIWGNALEIINDSSRIKFRADVLNLLAKLGSTPRCELFDVAKELDEMISGQAKNKLESLRRKHTEHLSTIKDKVLNNRIKKQYESEEKKRTRKAELQGMDDIFSIILSSYRDVAVLCQGGNSDSILNIDRSETIDELAERLASKDIVAILARIEPLATYMTYNVNRRLIIENILLELEEASA